ncbi:MAG: ion transporter [Gammaproteobacteria bacterium]|nr:ion transporter [Gammaproteobacteria bacterium]MCF6363510.1 ion transporter [Gammaproteobacteria bacterium]
MKSAIPLRTRAGVWIESNSIQYLIIGLILLNAISLGIATSNTLEAQYGHWLGFFDNAVLTVFVIEIATKLYAFRWRFFSSAWNVFDFLIVAIALVPTSGPLEVLRVLRILRVLRLISLVPQLRVVAEALLGAIPGIISVAGLMSIIFYVFSVMATELFGTDHPEWFGSLGGSMYTLFQIMTLESWSMGIVRPVMETHAYAWAFFIPFILIATFTMLNLFIAIIVDAMQSVQANKVEQDKEDIEEVVQTERQQLSKEIQDLKKDINELKLLLRESHKSP